MESPSLIPFTATGLDLGKASFDFHWPEKTPMNKTPPDPC